MTTVQETHEQLFPPLSDEVERGLRASIERFGVLVPIVVDQDGGVIDGRHRKRIADELGVGYRVDMQRVDDPAMAIELQRTLNAIRRQLTSDQLREQIVFLAGQVDEAGVGIYSSRTIAKVTGVDEKHVRKTLESQLRTSPQLEGEQGARSDEHGLDLPKLRRGADGKIRPARKEPTKSTKEPTEGGDPVPAVAMTDHGLEFTHDPLELAKVVKHPVTDLFPELNEADYQKLLLDIKENGLKEPILVNAEGFVVDGRSRYRACIELGQTPIERTVQGNVWEVALEANKHRLTKGAAALALARMPHRPHGKTGDDVPPRRDRGGEILGVATSTVTRAVEVAKGGIGALHSLVADGLVTVATAARVASMSADNQLEYVRRVRAGEGSLAALKPPQTQAAGKTKSQYVRSSTISRDAVLGIVSTLSGMEMALRDVTALDSQITTEEARRWVKDLSKGMTRLRALTKMMEKHTQ